MQARAVKLSRAMTLVTAFRLVILDLDNIALLSRADHPYANDPNNVVVLSINDVN